MNNFFSSLKVYLPFLLFIICWWSLAFREKNDVSDPTKSALVSKDIALSSPLSLAQSLTNIDRHQLFQALSGNLTVMTELIVQWNTHTQLLISLGLDELNLLPKNEFLQSQFLHALLTINAGPPLNLLEDKYRLPYVIDDTGKKISLEHPFKRFLPQTFSSASFLLALTNPEEIVALPNRLRDQTLLYPKILTDQIPLTIDRHNSEKLFQADPEIAFIAHYSNPAAIETLSRQGILLYTMKDPSSVEDINEELLKIGHIINRPLEAELLKIFIEAAFLAIDNKLQIIKKVNDGRRLSPRLLFLNHHHNFSLPTPKTLTGQLLQRIGDMDLTAQYVLAHDQQTQWMVPLSKEQLVNLNPDYLFIAADNKKGLEQEIYRDKTLKDIEAIKKNHVYFFDEDIQHSPTQYIVLAYYDLVSALGDRQ